MSRKIVREHGGTDPLISARTAVSAPPYYILVAILLFGLGLLSEAINYR